MSKENSLVPLGKGMLPYYVKPLIKNPKVKSSRFGPLEILPVEITLEANKHLYSIDYGKNFYLDSKGYRQLVGAIGANVITPHVIPWTDEAGNPTHVNNPHVIHDKRGNITGAVCRKVMIGLNPQGDLAITDAFVQLDVGLLFAERIRKKIDDNPDAGEIMTLADWEALPPEKKKGHARMIYHQGSDAYDTTVLYYDLSHAKIKKAYKERAKLAQELVRRISSVTYRRLCQESFLTEQPKISADSILGFKAVKPDKFTPWEYQGEVKIQSYHIKHMSPALDMLCLAISLGKDQVLDDLQEQYGPAIQINKVADAGDEGIMDAEYEDEEGSEPGDTEKEQDKEPKPTPEPKKGKKQAQAKPKPPKDADPEPIPAGDEPKLDLTPEKDDEDAKPPEVKKEETPKAEPEVEPPAAKETEPEPEKEKEADPEPEEAGEPVATVDPMVVSQKREQIGRAIKLEILEDEFIGKICDNFDVETVEDLLKMEGADIVKAHKMITDKYFK